MVEKTGTTKKIEEFTAKVLNIKLGDSSQLYRRMMRNIYKTNRKVRVFHGTSLKNAKKIVSTGFNISNDFAGDGVFVKDKIVGCQFNVELSGRNGFNLMKQILRYEKKL